MKFICCDNPGENKKLEAKCNEDGLVIIFEYTATGTPQQNAYVERAFPMLMGRARAMIVEKLQFSLFLISCSQGILNASLLSWFLLLKIACLHVSFTAYENFTNYLKCIVISS